MSHYRRGENRPTKSGRAARIRVASTMSLARRTAVLTATVNRVNAGTVTAGQYLTEILGADPDYAAKYDSPYGRFVRRAFIALHGEEPARIRLALVGTRMHRKVGYRIDEPALEAAARLYPRTASFVATPAAEQCAPVEQQPQPAAEVETIAATPATPADETPVWAHFVTAGTGPEARFRRNLTVLRLTDDEAEQLADKVNAATTYVREPGGRVLVAFETDTSGGGTQHWVRIDGRSPLAVQEIKQRLGRNHATAVKLASEQPAPALIGA